MEFSDFFFFSGSAGDGQWDTLLRLSVCTVLASGIDITVVMKTYPSPALITLKGSQLGKAVAEGHTLPASGSGSPALHPP